MLPRGYPRGKKVQDWISTPIISFRHSYRSVCITCVLENNPWSGPYCLSRIQIARLVIFRYPSGSPKMGCECLTKNHMGACLVHPIRFDAKFAPCGSMWLVRSQHVVSSLREKANPMPSQTRPKNAVYGNRKSSGMIHQDPSRFMDMNMGWSWTWKLSKSKQDPSRSIQIHQDSSRFITIHQDTSKFIKILWRDFPLFDP